MEIFILILSMTQELSLLTASLLDRFRSHIPSFDLVEIVPASLQLRFTINLLYLKHVLTITDICVLVIFMYDLADC